MRRLNQSQVLRFSLPIQPSRTSLCVTLQLEISWLTGSQAQQAPSGLKQFLPKRQPQSTPQGSRPISLPPSSYSTTMSPQKRPRAAFRPKLACTSKEPYISKPSPISKKAVMGGWCETCYAVIWHPYIYVWNVSPMAGLKALSISMNRSEQVRMTALKAFMRSIGFLRPVSNLGARLRHRQQVSRMLSGFMAKTGKLMPMNEPVERNLEMRNLNILGCMLLFQSLMNRRPPSSGSRRQSAVLQYYSYSTSSLSSLALAQLAAISCFCSFYWADRSCCSFVAARCLQSMHLGFCIFCYGTSLQSRKKVHSLYTQTTRPTRSPFISYTLSPDWSISVPSRTSHLETE